MKGKFEQSELKEKELQDVVGGNGIEILTNAEEIAKFQKDCWDQHNHEYDESRCQQCTKIGDMSKSICKLMLSK